MTEQRKKTRKKHFTKTTVNPSSTLRCPLTIFVLIFIFIRMMISQDFNCKMFFFSLLFFAPKSFIVNLSLCIPFHPPQDVCEEARNEMLTVFRSFVSANVVYFF